MECEHYKPHPHGAACQLKGKVCSFGVCKNCPDNTTKGIWPTIKSQTIQIVPTVEEQRRWLDKVVPVCTNCNAYGGTIETPDMKIVVKVKCGRCKTCGGNTVGPLQRRCPDNKW